MADCGPEPHPGVTAAPPGEPSPGGPSQKKRRLTPSSPAGASAAGGDGGPSGLDVVARPAAGPRLLARDDANYTLFPIRYPAAFRMYKQHLASFWTAEEVDLSEDALHYKERLTPSERGYVDMILAFFAASDGIVMENLCLRFQQEIQVPEIRCFYSVQLCMEAIHSEMYSLLIETLVAGAARKQELFRAIDTLPAVRAKADWALEWLRSDAPFAQRLVAFAFVEGVFFSASFCGVFYFKKRNLLPGLASSNLWISRDEGLHCDFACLLYTQYLEPEFRLPPATVHAMARSAVAVEAEFVRASLPAEILGLNAGLLIQYVEMITDRLLVALGYAKLWHTENPFPWMDAISMRTSANFFERRESSYAGRSGVVAALQGVAHHRFDTNVDF